MNNLFARSSSPWVRYSEYEIKASHDGVLYVVPTTKATPTVYDPLKKVDQLVIDAVNIGIQCMNRAKDTVLQKAMLEFVSRYGLLGFMTALPTTPNFMEYEAVYLPKNHFITEETLGTNAYTDYFYPFTKPDFTKQSLESIWNVSYDKQMMALALTFRNKPLALNMSFQREYAERYDWLLRQCKDWAFVFYTSFLYYEDYESIDEDTRSLYRESMAAFDGIAPSYHIALLDQPTIVWDFHSLLLGIQMMFSFMLTDEKTPLRACKHCNKAFIANRANAAFCSPQCKNQFNVYKGRKGKNK